MKVVADQAATAMARRMAEDRRREAEAESELERERLRAIIDEVPIGIMLFTPDGEMLDISAASRRLWELPAAKDAEPQPRLSDIAAFRHDTREPMEADDWPLWTTSRQR